MKKSNDDGFLLGIFFSLYAIALVITLTLFTVPVFSFFNSYTHNFLIDCLLFVTLGLPAINIVAGFGLLVTIFVLLCASYIAGFVSSCLTAFMKSVKKSK